MKHLSPLEQRLEDAAREVRQAARHSVPPPIDDWGRSRIQPEWLVFAAAFAVVILAMGVIPLLSGSGEPDATAAEPSPTAAQVPSTTAPTTSTTRVTAAECSAVGLPMPAEQDGLPAPVAETRRAIAAAAIACDYETLGSLAGPELTTSFGGGGFDNIPKWEEDGTYPALRLLVELFDTPFATQDFEDLPRYYVWPSAFVYDTWEEIPQDDLDALLTVYTQEEIDQHSGFGSYALWRIGITEDGQWQFFVAGD
jgi:hypothetical protein